MTLKKCTVTKLDDVFWRVDFDEKISIGSSDLKSPQVVKRFGDRWFFQGFPGDDAGDPDELLRMVGLTRHDPQPGTAEARVRRDVTYAARQNFAEVTVHTQDLRAILADLDYLRRAEVVLAAKAKSAVNVEAVLAPVRSHLVAWEERVNSLAASRDAHMAKLPGVSPNYIEAGIAEVERWSLMVAAKSLRTAIAEAEKVAAVKP